MTIEQAEDRNLLIGYDLVTDSHEVEEVLNYLGKSVKKRAETNGISGLFVLQSYGDYEAVYGFAGSVPYNSKELLRLKGSITKER